ncbi:nicotinamide riboside transporter PnuC [Pseudoduganella albidiflava]|uniref:Nicotinamide riboside transporter PnuC n=1 Tax=Pseudoduganella albidiflava TaxID=321983 RepID=A0A411WUZ9_9BURK|nr:nicotinamide riboside transporter PnuC [Pseudoduganella albidiflava]QBI00621.1 nicotinamide riboside transporter PnuC [Pseudoduganella albidiflava]GGY31923.1 membrane protein [Pseudoduganella albidiflava]
MNETLNLLGLSTTPLELLSFVLSIATVWLNIRQNHWAWLFAILSSALYGVVFFQAKLYGDMGLQLVFITVSVWGWYQWLHGDDTHARLPVTQLAWRGRAVAALGWLAGFAALAWFLMTFTDTDVPFADGFLTAGSLVGQLLLSRKKLENWHVWIIVDVLYVALYVHKGLMLTALLYGLFVAMAAIGLLAWRKSMLAEQRASEAMVLR